MTGDFYDYPELYDVLLPVGSHLPFYTELARAHGGAVLELACGTGQLAVPIAAAGVPTTGLDLSPAMLDRARERARGVGVSIDFVEADMRQFDLRREFDVIFVARNSMLHVLSTEDLIATLKAVRRHLPPAGLFAFDVFNPDVRILARPSDQRFPVMTVDDPGFGELRVEGGHSYDASTQVDRSTWYVSTSAERDKWVFPVTVRSIFPRELPLLVAAAGMDLIERFGNLDRAPFGAASPMQVCLCRRAA